MAAGAGGEPLSHRVLNAEPAGKQRGAQRSGQAGNHHASRGNGSKAAVTFRNADSNRSGAAFGHHGGSYRIIYAEQMAQPQHAENTGQAAGGASQKNRQEILLLKLHTGCKMPSASTAVTGPSIMLMMSPPLEKSS